MHNQKFKTINYIPLQNITENEHENVKIFQVMHIISLAESQMYSKKKNKKALSSFIRCFPYPKYDEIDDKTVMVDEEDLNNRN